MPLGAGSVGSRAGAAPTVDVDAASPATSVGAGKVFGMGQLHSLFVQEIRRKSKRANIEAAGTQA
jgi:hypothetical protein